ncbi:MAG TPA: DUF5110 domain-containing protein, partial [Bacteroidales bacterium]
GADGQFTLYSDEGDNYNYEKGSYTAITFSWNEQKNTLTINDRKNSFAGMLNRQIFKIVIVSVGKEIGEQIVRQPHKMIAYTGKKITVSF